MPTLKRESHVRPLVLRYLIVLPCLAVLIGLGVLFVRWRSTAKPLRQIRAIAILPLENRAGDANQYLADGVTDRLIFELGSIPTLRVMARKSAASAGQENHSVPEVARRLEVDGVVNGSLIRVGNRIQVTTLLNDGESGVQLWKHEYSTDLSDTFQLARDAARDIAKAVGVDSQSLTHADSPVGQSSIPGVQDLYLQGKYFLNVGGIENDHEALGYFQKAIEKDPTFAPAYAAMAATYNDLGQGGMLNYAEAYGMAKQAATRAIELNGSLAEAFAALADAAIGLNWDWAAAEANYRRALELNPNSSSVRFAYARYLEKQGRSKEAMSEAQRALTLDPVSLASYYELAAAYYAAHDYDGALEAVHRAAELGLLSPNNPPLHWNLAVIYVEKGNFQKAIDEFKVVGYLPHTLGHMGNAYARVGQVKNAQLMISRLKEQVKKNGVGIYEIAIVYAGLGQKDEAFAWLEKAYAVHDKGLTFLKFDPCVDPLRSDPRFISLLHRVGLAG